MPDTAASLRGLLLFLVPSRDVAAQPGATLSRSLLDPVAVLTAFGDDAEGLRRMYEDFQTYAPSRLAEVGDALRDRNTPRLHQGLVRSLLPDTGAQRQIDGRCYGGPLTPVWLRRCA